MRERATFGTLVILGIMAYVAAVKADDEKMTLRETPSSSRSEGKAACREKPSAPRCVAF